MKTRSAPPGCCGAEIEDAVIGQISADGYGMVGDRSRARRGQHAERALDRQVAVYGERPR